MEIYMYIKPLFLMTQYQIKRKRKKKLIWVMVYMNEVELSH